MYFYFETTMRKCGIILRIIILIVTPILFTFYFYTITKGTIYPIDINDMREAPDNLSAASSVVSKIDRFYNDIDTIKFREDRLRSLMKLPDILFGYDFYVKNDIVATIEDNKTIDVAFGVNINNNSNKIKSGEVEKIFNIPNISELSIIKWDYSFEYSFNNSDEMIPEGAQINYHKDRRHISFYLKPALPNYLIVFLFGLVLWYAFLLLMANCYKFIIFNKPFSKNNT